MKIEKMKNSMDCYNFCLINGNKELKIIFLSNLDLYMIISNGEKISPDKCYDIDFDITKEDKEIFSIFDSIYNEIVSCNIFVDKKLNYKNLKDSNEYKHLVDNNLNIKWISDNGIDELEDSLTISRLEDKGYRLIFHRNNSHLDCGFKSNINISIRFSNSGSRYRPFNIPFMKMYHKLLQIDPNKFNNKEK